MSTSITTTTNFMDVDCPENIHAAVIPLQKWINKNKHSSAILEKYGCHLHTNATWYSWDFRSINRQVASPEHESQSQSQTASTPFEVYNAWCEISWWLEKIQYYHLKIKSNVILVLSNN
jgi:hypothetical protein